MFRNIGGKIQALAKITSICGMILSIIAGIMMIAADETAAGIVIIILGILVSWISAFTLYGFGKLIETNENTMHMIKDIGTMIEELANDVYSTSLSDETQTNDTEPIAKPTRGTLDVHGISHIIGKPTMKK